MEQSFNQSLINISTEYSNLYTSQIRSAVTVDELFGKGSGADASGGAVVVTEYNTLISAPEIIIRGNQTGIPVSVGLKIRLGFQSCQGYIALIPKDYEGFITIGRLLNEATENTKGQELLVTLGTLERYFLGHDNVIITTLSGWVSRIICLSWRILSPLQRARASGLQG